MFRSRYRRRSWKFLALAVVAGAVVFLTAGGAVALFFLVWMPFPSSTSPGKAGATTVVVAPSKSARLASPVGDVLLEFPARSVAGKRQCLIAECQLRQSLDFLLALP